MATICLIGINYAPEPIGIGPFTQGWAEALVAGGHRVGVICGEPYYPAWTRTADTGPPFVWNCENGVQVMRVPHYVPANPTAVGRLVQQASFAASAYRGLQRAGGGGRPDLVMAIAPVLLSAPVALRLAVRSGALSWIHVHDFEADAAIATGLLPPWAGRLGLALENNILGRFDRASSISPRMVERLAARRGDAATTVELRNWAEPGVGAAPADGDRMRQELGLPHCTLALYSGNLARKQGIDVIIEAARSMQTRDDLAFVVCGDGPSAGRVAAAASGLPNFHFRSLQPRERLPDLLAMADIHLLPQIGEAADLVLPSKLANMLASGRPVVATADRGTSLAEEVEGCGLVVPAGDIGAFASAIATLADDPARRAELGEAARRRASEQWSKTALVTRFTCSLEQALEEHRA